jgi:general secretion pathway protein E/type IV pilus assembly protein PilB
MPLQAPDIQLREWLHAGGLEAEEEVDRIVEAAGPGVSWITHVLNSGLVDEPRFIAAVAETLGMPYLDVQARNVERDVLEAIPSRLVFLHVLLPIRRENGVLTIATYDPFNALARQLVRQAVDGRAEWVLAPRAQLLQAIKTLYGVGAETFEEILKNQRSFDSLAEEDLVANLDANDPEASVVKFVNQIIREAIGERATDIHVEPLEGDLRIRYRIDGILHAVAVPPQLRLLQNAIITRLKIMAKMDIAERRLPQDGRIQLQSGDSPIDVRVSTVPTVNGESVSLRLLSRDEDQKYDLDKLDLAAHDRETIEKLLVQPNGIILVTGPTGSGKSTSLYSFLSKINSVQRRIITVEEPVEYRLPGVMQIDVKSEIDLSFAKALRSILRQDPNVIMVGEIRDFETAEIAIRAAMTGHLVFSTLHTNDAVSGITRLLDMGIEPFLLASVVRAFLAQRLVRRICPYCSSPASYDAGYLKTLNFPVDRHGVTFKRGRGCDQCRDTGFLGRCAIYEVCCMTEHLHDLVIKRSSASELKDQAMADGMRTLRQDGWRRVVNGQTTLEEVVRVTELDSS